MSPLRYILNSQSYLSGATLQENSYFGFLSPTTVVWLSVLLIFLIMCSAFFSSAETAYSSVNIIRLKTYIEEKKRGAKKALWIAENFDRTLSTILVGNNFVNIAATTVAALILGNLISNPTISNIINTIGMTIIILIFGEITPKSYAKEHSETYALHIAGILYILMKVLYPIVIVFIWFRRALFRKKPDNVPTVTESELESIIETMEDQGVIDSLDADWLQGVIDIGDHSVNDIMVPRVDIVGIEVSMSPDEIKDLFFEYKYSRMPVYKDDKDHIIGILSERDFFTAFVTKQKIDLRTLVTTPLFVSKTLKVDDLIRKMQNVKKHFAIVSDEYGGTSGIVTMEDAIEVLFGEIYDEHDEDAEADILKIDENSYEILADVQVEELFEILELGKAPETMYPNIGGFLYSLAEELPIVNQVIDFPTDVFRTDESGLLIEVTLILRFTILSVVERRILKVKLDIIEPSEEEDKDKNRDEIE